MDSSANTLARKVITAPSLKRGKDETTPVNERVKLEKVLGLTVTNNAGLDSDSNNERVAYPAGCTVVLLDTIKGKQSHIQNSSKKTITCVGFSSDGRYLATGECGHSPSVRLWDLHELTMVAELTGHKYSVNCLAFSPTQKYVVSVGSQHDMIVNVWDWRSGIKVASNKVSTKVKAISFAENGTYFVTAGNRHVKFWYLEYHRGSKYKEPVPLMGRSAILGEQRNNDFVDVACGRGDTADSTYTITRSGLLCEFNNRRLLDKWVELRTTSANCMTLGEQRIFIGCADGIVRCFDPRTLQFITTLPRTHYLGVDVSQGLDISHMATHPNQAKYPDAIAVTYDERNAKLTCVYNDHSLYVWDVRDIKRVGKSHSNLYHSACIWGVEIFPEGSTCPVPPGSFVTCSSDDTIRVWSIDTHLKTQPDSVYQRNIYSNELVKVIYVDPEMTCLKDVELASGEKTENPTAYDGKNGVRALRISPDGKHLASGDRSGNIRVHDTTTLEEICLIEAHDAEVLCLEYNRQLNGKRLLASASRDRLVHVFDVDEDYNFLQTLDDHSSSITAVRFLNGQSNLQMVSCGADKSIIFRQLQSCPDGQIQFNRIYNAAGKTTLYDMEVDFSHKYVITACQDRNIRVYNVSAGKHTKTFKGSIGEEGSLIKVALDASGIYVATSCTDKTLCIYDFYSGECMATMSGHSELVTGLRFSQDCTRLISASGDGCVLVWSVPHDMVVTMQARLSQQAARSNYRGEEDGYPGAFFILDAIYVVFHADTLVSSPGNLTNSSTVTRTTKNLPFLPLIPSIRMPINRITGKRSLSSQHHGNQQQMSTRNSNLIQAAKTTKNDVNALSKREELQRRIQETRRQLQSVGYRSNLKTSRSIQDLSIHGPYGTGSGGGGESRSKGSLASKSGRNFQQQALFPSDVLPTIPPIPPFLRSLDPIHPQYNVNSSSIRRARMKYRATYANNLKRACKPKEIPLTIHWDGKMLEDITGHETKASKLQTIQYCRKLAVVMWSLCCHLPKNSWTFSSQEMITRNC
ncbi:unnamed protein product [Nesidiocoris tenuis]|uniref:WD repeat-containing protein 55 homolog n=1 Tax=Nesidiocoris tenuis TaxID=355587 RepID=A0A6H5GWV6_9HEMI|nr:unnamed protein product [Nesidiocoris tenuis]